MNTKKDPNGQREITMPVVSRSPLDADIPGVMVECTAEEADLYGFF